MLKVVGGSGNGVPVTFLVRGPALLDRFFKTVVEIFVLSAFRDLGLVVEFDLVDQEAGETLRLAVNVLIFRRHGSRRRSLWYRVDLSMDYRLRFGQRRIDFDHSGVWFSDRGVRLSDDCRRFDCGTCDRS